MQAAPHHVPPDPPACFVLAAVPSTPAPVPLARRSDGRHALAPADATAYIEWAWSNLPRRAPEACLLALGALICERLRVAPERTPRFRDAERLATALVERVQPDRDRFRRLWVALSAARQPAWRALRVGVLIAGVARQRALARTSQIQLVLAGLTLDLGATLLPDDAPLRMRVGHPQLTADLLRAHGVGPGLLRDGVTGHHERMDGRGAPVGLLGPALSFAARVTSLCDAAIDALAPPTIGPALPRYLALERLMADRDAFDPALVVDCVRLFARRDARW